MAGKKKLTLKAVDANAERVDERPRPRLGGIVGAAANEQVRNTREELERHKGYVGDIRQGVLEGRVPVLLVPSQVTDEVGTDRLDEWTQGEEFEQLLENIRERGQTQAIRVRPADPEWQPDAATPDRVDENVPFIIQSGRRRLEACRRLGIKVVASIAMPEGEVALQDLKERYFENRMRKNLSPLEDLLAIAAIAKKMEGMPQREIAQRINVNPAYVSWGLDCDRHYEVLKDYVDSSSSLSRIRDIIPLVKAGDLNAITAVMNAEPAAEAAADPKPQETARPRPAVRAVREVSLARGGALRIQRTGSGYKMSLRNVDVPQDRSEEFERDLAALVEKYQQG